MSINVNGNQNQIDLRKLMQARQSGKTGATARTQNKDPRMSMNGSIFGSRAQMVSGQQNSVNSAGNEKGSVNNVANVNTTKAISGLNNISTGNSTEKTQNSKGQEQKNLNIGSIDFDNLGTLSLSELQTVQNDLKSMVDGDAPFFLVKPFEQKLNKVNAEVKRRSEEDGSKLSEDNKKIEEKNNEAEQVDAESGTETAKSGSKTSESNTNKMKMMSSETESLDHDIKSRENKFKKDEKKLKSEITKNIKANDKETKNIEKLTQENEEISTEIEAKNEKIATLSATQDSSSQGEIESAQADIENLNNLTSTNSAKMNKSQVVIKKNTAASNAKVRRLTKNAKTFTRTVSSNQKQIQANQQESNKTMDVANKIENVSQKVAAVGLVTKLAGKLLMKSSWPPTVAAGAVMVTVGTGAETAGNYGVCAANITKTAVNVAQGNLTGALVTAGTALLSGASAAKGTKQITASIKNSGNVGGFINNMAGKSTGKKALDAFKSGIVKDASNLGKDAVSGLGKELMEYGTPLMAAGSALGGAQQQQIGGTGVAKRRVIAQSQHSRRRKIA